MADQPSGASVSQVQGLNIHYENNHTRCDADPAALAKYVLALIKKDKPVEELKVVI